MKEKKKIVKLILCIITFTVVLVYLINHTEVIWYLLSGLASLLLPFLIGCGIAFILNIPMRGIENGLFKKEDGKLYKAKRPISMVITYLLAVLVVGLVIFVVVPEVRDTVTVIYKDRLPTFVDNAKAWALKYTTQFPEITKAITNIEIDWNKVGGMFKNGGGTVLSTTVSIFSSIISMIVNIFVGLVFSFYILAQKETLGRQAKMLCYAMCKESTADELMVFGKIANNTFSKFFACQFREGIILGTMFVIAMSIIGMPYPLTIGILIAFTALIPIFGAFIGLFIGCFLILVEAPKMVLWFIVLFFVLQFIENYFIYPKLVGGDIGLSAIWVLLAVLVGGDLMGVVGMFIFIPLVSVFYAYFRSIVYRSLKKKHINVDEKEVPEDVLPLMEGRRRLFQRKTREIQRKKAEEQERQEQKEQEDSEQEQIAVQEQESTSDEKNKE